MIKIALTGGIGSGKTTVSKIFFENFGIPTIDTDKLARNAVSSKSIGLQQIVKHFGVEILNKKGELDRPKIKQIIFSDYMQKKKLEEIIHPLVYELLEKELAKTISAYCLIAVPILNKQSKILSTVDRVLLVDCKESIRTKRAVERDKLGVSFVREIIKSQPSHLELKELATDIIENNNGLTKLNNEVAILHKKFANLISL